MPWTTDPSVSSQNHPTLPYLITFDTSRFKRFQEMGAAQISSESSRVVSFHCAFHFLSCFFTCTAFSIEDPVLFIVGVIGKIIIQCNLNFQAFRLRYRIFVQVWCSRAFRELCSKLIDLFLLSVADGSTLAGHICSKFYLVVASIAQSKMPSYQE